MKPRFAFISAATATGTVLLLAFPASAREATPSVNVELATKGAWDANTKYRQDDIVTARGSAWIAKRDNRNKMPGTDAAFDGG